MNGYFGRLKCALLVVLIKIIKNKIRVWRTIIICIEINAYYRILVNIVSNTLSILAYLTLTQQKLVLCLVRSLTF